MTVINQNSGASVFDVLADAVSSRMSTGVLCIIKGLTTVNDGLGGTYRVEPNGSGGIAMANGNELVLLGSHCIKGTDPTEVPTNATVLSTAGRVYDSVAAMKADPNLSVGDKVRTAGYYGGWAASASGEPKGGCDYVIVAAGTGTDDGGSYIDLSASGLQAKAVFGKAAYVEQFGAVGDGITDDTIAFNSAVSAKNKIKFASENYFINGPWVIPEGTRIYGPATILVNSVTGDLFNITSGNVKVFDLKVKGESPRVFLVNGNNVDFIDCEFETDGTRLGQCILLRTTDNVRVDRCTFKGTGYGILQGYGYVSSNVTISNCIADGVKNDFIEANCGAPAESKNWTIVGNQFFNGFNYEAAKVAQAVGDFATYKECRFVGITGVTNVTIANNIADKIAGDSAIHIEDVGGRIVINGNIIDNSLGFGYIFIGNPVSDPLDNDCLISNNLFLRSDNTSLVGNVLHLSSLRTVQEIKFSDNQVLGDPIKNLTMSTISDNLSIVDNVFENCTTAIPLDVSNKCIVAGNKITKSTKAISAKSARDLTIDNNKISECDFGIDLGDGTVTLVRSTEDVTITNNVFKDIAGYNLIVRRSLDGTLPPARIDISNNRFDKPTDAVSKALTISGTGAGSPIDCIVANNKFFNLAEALVVADSIVYVDNYFDSLQYRQSAVVYNANIAVAPEQAGIINIDTTTGNVYISTGTAAAGNWVQLN